MDLCLCCGEPAWFEITEVCLKDREVFVDACCEANQVGWLDAIQSCSRRERSEWMLQQTGILVHDIIVTADAIRWTLDFGLRLAPVSFRVAKEFIATHHRHCKPPIGWKFGASVYNGDEMVGVMTAGRPVSAALDKQGYLEINRVCVEDIRPRALVRNACSMLYAFACREAFRRGYERVVTYTLASEDGASLRAAGFSPMTRSRGGPWNRRARPRVDDGPTEAKIRWERWKTGRIPHQLRFPPAFLLAA